MVTVSKLPKRRRPVRRDRNSTVETRYLIIAALGVGCLLLGYNTGWFSALSSSSPVSGTGSTSTETAHSPARLQVDAADIRNILSCDELTMFSSSTTAMAARRLDEAQEYPDESAAEDTELTMDDDFMMRGVMAQTYSARELFCQAAAIVLDYKNTTSYPCGNVAPAKLLELWSSGRFMMDESLLRQVVEDTEMQERPFVDTMRELWLPRERDEGLEYRYNVLNDRETKKEESIFTLGETLGPGTVWVDVGSSLGLSSIAVSILYPGTRIVSIEAAAPNWFVQRLNWDCGPATDSEVSVLLAGVGPVDGDGPQYSPMRYRTNATSDVRGWSRKKDTSPRDYILKVALRPWHQILTEAGLKSSHEIDVLNVVCEGCEYNFIPALSDDEFDSIHTVRGEVHWGYIPRSKKPSSERARQTHRRLCQHENFARTAKECCAFPDLLVKSSMTDSVLVVEGEGPIADHKVTVADVAGDLCDNFEIWRVEKHLDTIASDVGWFQLTSAAEDDTI